jgi:hypothetical protein
MVNLRQPTKAIVDNKLLVYDDIPLAVVDYLETFFKKINYITTPQLITKQIHRISTDYHHIRKQFYISTQYHHVTT